MQVKCQIFTYLPLQTRKLIICLASLAPCTKSKSRRMSRKITLRICYHSNLTTGNNKNLTGAHALRADVIYWSLEIWAPKISKIDFLLSYNVGWTLILKVSLSWVHCWSIWNNSVFAKRYNWIMSQNQLDDVVTAKSFQIQQQCTQLNEWSTNIVAQKEVNFPNFWCSDLQYITSARFACAKRVSNDAPRGVNIVEQTWA